MRICTKYATRMLDDAKLDIEDDENRRGGRGRGRRGRWVLVLVQLQKSMTL